MKKIAKVALMLMLFSSASLYANEALLKQAKNGDAEAQYKIAALYAMGKMGDKSPQSKKEMFAWLERAAEQDHLKSIEILCSKYTELGKDKSALKWAEIAMKKKSEVGKSAMALLYAKGAIGLPMDLAKALEYARATSSKPLSKVTLAMLYSRGYFEIEKDLDRAIELVNEGIKQNSYAAHDYLVNLYIEEFLRTRDPINLTKAKEVLGKLEKDFPEFYAVGCLTIELLEGKSPSSVLKELEALLNDDSPPSYFSLAGTIAAQAGNPQKQAQYLIKAAEAGFAKAAFQAWVYMVSGKDGIEPNKEKAKEFLDLAIDSCDPLAITPFCFGTSGLKKLFPHADLKKIDDQDIKSLIKKGADNGGAILQLTYANDHAANQEEKLKYLMEAAKNRVPNASVKAAIMLSSSEEPEMAFNACKIGADYKEPDAAALYGRFLLDGIGCERNIQLGLENTELAAVFGNQFAGKRLFMEYIRGQLIEADFRKAYIWGNIAGNSEDKALLEEYLVDYSEEEIREFDQDVDLMRKQIEKNKSEYANRLKQISTVLATGGSLHFLPF